jgi:hypothetical protein
VSELARASRRQDERKRQLSGSWNSAVGQVGGGGDSAEEFLISAEDLIRSELASGTLKRHDLASVIGPTSHFIFW